MISGKGIGCRCFFLAFNRPSTLRRRSVGGADIIDKRIVSGCPAEDCEEGMEYNEEWEDDEYDPDEV